MTKQALFNKVAQHLLTQQKKAATRSGTCMYRTQTGLSCAIGCLIPDNKYDKSFEGVGIDDTFWDCEEDLEFVRDMRKIMRAAGLVKAQTKLASELQNVHDFYSVKQWPQELERVAEEFGLKSTIVQQLVEKQKKQKKGKK